MVSKRLSREAGHRRKFLAIIDETPECERAVAYASKRAQEHRRRAGAALRDRARRFPALAGRREDHARGGDRHRRGRARQLCQQGPPRSSASSRNWWCARARVSCGQVVRSYIFDITTPGPVLERVDQLVAGMRVPRPAGLVLSTLDPDGRAVAVAVLAGGSPAGAHVRGGLADRSWTTPAAR